MRITGIYIKDFGNHRETTIDLKHALSIFRGPNESGKTIIRDAVQWVFTGMCRGMEKRKDEPNLIRHSAKQAEVQVLFDHNALEHKITRTVSASAQTLILQKEGKVKATGLKDAQAAIYDVLQVSEALLANLFDAFELSRLASKDRKKIIQALFTSDSPDVLEKYLIDNGHSGLAKATINGTGSTHMDLILAAYESKGIEGASAYAVDQRVFAKRELRELVDPEAPEGKGMTKDEMETALADFRKVQAERDNLAGPVMSAAKEAAEPDQRAGVEDKIRELQKQMEPKADLAAAVKKMGEALTEAMNADASAQVEESGTPGPALAAHLNALSVLTVTGSEASKKSIAWLEGEIAKLEGAAPKAGEVKKHEPLAPAAQVDYDAAMKAELDNRMLDGRVAVLKEQIASESEAMNKTLSISKGWTPEQVQGEISKLDTQLEVLRKKCSASDLITDYEKRKAEVVKKRGFLHKKIVNWDSACKVLDPKHEALAALFSSGKERFDNQFKQITKAMGLETYLADDYTFRSTGFGQADSYGWLSKSRQFRVGAALLIAICEQIGFHTVILDEGDILYAEAKTDMTKIFRSVQASGLNAMLFTTGKAEAQEINDDTHIYAVEEGRVS